jgi:excisionase family DNA binding protein
MLGPTSTARDHGHIGDPGGETKGVCMPIQLYTVDEAALRLNTTPRFIRRLIAERRIAFTRLGRHIRIEGTALDAFVASGRVEAIQPAPRSYSSRSA